MPSIFPRSLRTNKKRVYWVWWELLITADMIAESAAGWASKCQRKGVGDGRRKSANSHCKTSLSLLHRFCLSQMRIWTWGSLAIWLLGQDIISQRSLWVLHRMDSFSASFFLYFIAIWVWKFYEEITTTTPTLYFMRDNEIMESFANAKNRELGH